MGAGITLLVVGAILAVALKTDSPWLNLHVVGVILMLGGAGSIWRARTRRRVVVEEEHEHDGDHTTVVERRVE